MIKNILFIFLISILLISCTNKKENKNTRWYTNSQVLDGAKIYNTQCITCHNKDAIGDVNWKKRLKDGSYPPPALNGNAHTWHHSFDSLKRTIKKGSGKMPSFSRILSEKDIKNVLAYVQDKWDDRVYESWFRISGLKNNKDKN